MTEQWSTQEQMGEHPIFAPGTPIHCVTVCQDADHARRIVACLNACDCISTEQLESGAGSVCEWLDQRDALLAALESICEEFGNTKPSKARMGQIANDALASVKGHP